MLSGHNPFQQGVGPATSSAPAFDTARGAAAGALAPWGWDRKYESEARRLLEGGPELLGAELQSNLDADVALEMLRNRRLEIPPRPEVFQPPGKGGGSTLLFREFQPDGIRKKRGGKHPDRWRNSGGKQGARDLPMDDPKLRRRYGIIRPADDSQCVRPWRYHEYCLLYTDPASGSVEEDRTVILFHVIPPFKRPTGTGSTPRTAATAARWLQPPQPMAEDLAPGRAVVEMPTRPRMQHTQTSLFLSPPAEPPSAGGGGGNIAMPAAASVVSGEPPLASSAPMHLMGGGYGSGPPPALDVPPHRLSSTLSQRTSKPRWAADRATGSWVSFEDAQVSARRDDDDQIDDGETAPPRASGVWQHPDEPDQQGIIDVSGVGWSTDESPRSPSPESATGAAGNGGYQHGDGDEDEDEDEVCDDIVGRPCAPPPYDDQQAIMGQPVASRVAQTDLSSARCSDWTNAEDELLRYLVETVRAFFKIPPPCPHRR
jgi:hypothetical protein